MWKPTGAERVAWNFRILCTHFVFFRRRLIDGWITDQSLDNPQLVPARSRSILQTLPLSHPHSLPDLSYAATLGDVNPATHTD